MVTKTFPILAGVDIGGTKCAVCLGQVTPERVRLLERREFPTPRGPDRTLEKLVESLAALMAGRSESPEREVAAVGVSCGGPLDSARGLVLSPPNLPGWDRVDVLAPFRERFGLPAALQNDANACALAEWRWGAGRGCRSLIFMTFGTGMGTGLILNGQVYSGASDMAGEVGHVRLAETGPLGYGKSGSFEGYCSGTGIARLAQSRALARIQAGDPPAFAQTLAALEDVTAETVALAAQQGDPLAIEVYQTAGHYLGRGLALLVDILNPERIVLGSIYSRQRALLEPAALRVLRREAHPRALAACEVVPAGLGERVGDYAGLALAATALEN